MGWLCSTVWGLGWGGGVVAMEHFPWVAIMGWTRLCELLWDAAGSAGVGGLPRRAARGLRPAAPQGREGGQRHRKAGQENANAGTHQTQAETKTRWEPGLPTSRGFCRNPRLGSQDSEAAVGCSRLQESAGFCLL